jgi:Ca2+-binding EF-hand superfamily protein
MTNHVKLTPKEIKQWKQIFETLDNDKNGTISINELRVLCDMVGWMRSDDELKKMIGKFDENQNGEIEFEELLLLVEHGFNIY